jgi:hypothetical protein
MSELLRCTNCAYEIDEANALGMCYNCQQAYEKGRQAGTDKPIQADEPGLYEVTVFKIVSSVESNYNSATEAREKGARLVKLWKEGDPSAIEYFFDIAQHSDYCEACNRTRWQCVCKGA